MPDMMTIWLAILIISVVVEVATTGLVSIWFCFGAAAAMLMAALKLPEVFQIIVFFVVSLVLLFITKPLVKRFIYSKNTHTNADRILEQKGIVTQEVNNLKGTGAIKVDGKEWTARSAIDQEVIAVGTEVTIKEIQGVKAIVLKYQEK